MLHKFRPIIANRIGFKFAFVLPAAMQGSKVRIIYSYLSTEILYKSGCAIMNQNCY